MNRALLAAGMLSVGIGAAHSYLGERFILIRLFRRSDLPTLFGSDQFTRHTLRFAWHLTTVAWWGFGALFVVMASAAAGEPAWRSVGVVAAAMFGLSAAVTLVGSRGRHLAWLVFLAIALAAWYGTRQAAAACGSLWWRGNIEPYGPTVAACSEATGRRPAPAVAVSEASPDDGPVPGGQRHLDRVHVLDQVGVGDAVRSVTPPARIVRMNAEGMIIELEFQRVFFSRLDADPAMKARALELVERRLSPLEVFPAFQVLWWTSVAAVQGRPRVIWQLLAGGRGGGAAAMYRELRARRKLLAEAEASCARAGGAASQVARTRTTPTPCRS